MVIGQRAFKAPNAAWKRTISMDRISKISCRERNYLLSHVLKKSTSQSVGWALAGLQRRNCNDEPFRLMQSSWTP